ncbi:MAG: hypothetical protein DA328_06805, partial [Nitrososphaeraceae archaeon]|nr:hypothetical protein [Nitrososphaeraceae archaeon]
MDKNQGNEKIKKRDDSGRKFLTSKILLSHDGSKMSDIALGKAKEFAKAFNAELYILHVIEHVPIPASLSLGNDRQWIAEARRSIAKK